MLWFEASTVRRISVDERTGRLDALLVAFEDKPTTQSRASGVYYGGGNSFPFYHFHHYGLHVP